MEKPISITMYGAAWCGDCVRAKFSLDNLGVAYTYIDIDENPQHRETVLSYNKSVKGEAFQSIPVIVFSDETVLIEPTPKKLYRELEKNKLV